MGKKAQVVDISAAFGVIGLFLMLVVARLVDPAYAPQRGLVGSAAGFAARRAIDAIAAIGWLIDRLPLASAAALDTAATRPAHAA